MNLHNRWVQLSASLVAMIMIANLQYSWTLFVKPIQHATGWKLSDIQWGFTIFILCQTWVQVLEGWLIDRLGQRMFITLAGVLCGIGWAGLSQARTLPALYALYATAGLGASLVYGASMGSALKWFRERRGLASGLMAAGYASGASLFIPIIAATIAGDGYRAAFLRTGIFQGLVIIVVAQFLRLPPREAATSTTAKGRVGAHQYSTVEMLGSGHFYLLYAMFLLMGIGGLLVTAQVGPIATTWGLSTRTLVLAASLSPLANGGGRIFWGQVSDRIGREKTMMIAFTIQGACLWLVLFVGPTSPVWFILTLLATYFTWGEIYALFPAALTDYFGTRHATSNNCVLYTSKGVASIIAGGWAAKIFETYGTWTPAFAASALMALGSAALAVSLWRTAVSDRSRALAASMVARLPAHPCHHHQGRSEVTSDPASGAVGRLADELEAAYARGTSVVPPSAREGGLSLEAAYAVEAELVRRRRAAGHRIAGVKVGFANKAMWRILKLDTLVWAHMYDDTVQMVGASRATHTVAGRLSPRLEPEVVFKLSRPLPSGVTDPSLILDAIEWLALGYEINDCVFPDWKFQPADFVAAYGFHTALLVGPGRPPRPADADALGVFPLLLSRNGEVVERGSGRNALRNPALCLAELVTAYGRRNEASLDDALGAGALVSTGTLTTPQPLAPGDIWQADAQELDLPPLTLEMASRA